MNNLDYPEGLYADDIDDEDLDDDAAWSDMPEEDVSRATLGEDAANQVNPTTQTRPTTMLPERLKSSIAAGTRGALNGAARYVLKNHPDEVALWKEQLFGAGLSAEDWAACEWQAQMAPAPMVKQVNENQSNGSVADIRQLMNAKQEPAPAETAEVPEFTDSVMAQLYADDVLKDRFVSTRGLGWMAYNGQVWRPSTDGAPLEALRQHAIDSHAKAYMEIGTLLAQRAPIDGAEKARRGWKSAQSTTRLRNALGLAQNIKGIARDAAEFDPDPDMLNTPSGLVDLRTGEISPHQPGHMCSRITAVDYVPGAEHASFKEVLGSINPDAVDWLQLHFGQAITGHHSPDMVLLTGQGRNGKTALLGVLTAALGARLGTGAGYAAMVPNTLLLNTTKGGPTPEKMTLMGLRFGYMEETPEDGHLNALALKEVVDTGTITGRHLYKDEVTFPAMHSLFLNTNHAPQVAGTDTAIWRRLARVDFPHRYRANQDGLGPWLDTDREGISNLKAQLATQEAQEAALAWMVAGALRWYAAGRTRENATTPTSVTESIKAWRSDTDLLLTFLTDHFEFEATSWTWSASVFRTFSEWLLENGHKRMGVQLFKDRITGHTFLPGRVVAGKRRTGQKGYSAKPHLMVFNDPEAPKGGEGKALVGLRWKECPPSM